MLLRFLLIRW